MAAMMRLASVWMAAMVAAALTANGAAGQDVESEPAGPDLQKQIDDALKELDKLEKLDPDQPDEAKKQVEDVRRQVRQRLFLNLNGLNRGIVIGPGGIVRPARGPGRLGVALEAPSPTLQDHLNLPAGQGLVLSAVFPNSPAEKAGLLRHDLLLEIDGKAVASDIAALQKDLLERKPGTEIDATVIRKGQRETVKGIKLGDARGNGFAPPPGVPVVPPIDIPIFPNVPLIPPGGFGGAFPFQQNGNASTSIRVDNGNFEINHTSGKIRVAVKGTHENGVLVPSEIQIFDGDTKISVRALEDVAEAHRALIDDLLKRIR